MPLKKRLFFVLYNIDESCSSHIIRIDLFLYFIKFISFLHLFAEFESLKVTLNDKGFFSEFFLSSFIWRMLSEKEDKNLRISCSFIFIEKGKSVKYNVVFSSEVIFIFIFFVK